MSGGGAVLLRGCVLRRLKSAADDGIAIFCRDGATSLHPLVVAFIAPWIKDAVTSASACAWHDCSLNVPDLSVADFSNFVACLCDEAVAGETLLRARAAIANVLDIFASDFTRWLHDEAAGTAEHCTGDRKKRCRRPTAAAAQRRRTMSSAAAAGSDETDLSAIDARADDADTRYITDEELVQNFSDQDQRLVCVICFRIMAAANIDAFRDHLRHHSGADKRKVCFRRRRRSKRNGDDDGGDPTAAVVAFTCQDCGKSCANIAGFRAHARSHMQRGFKCANCEKLFLRPDLLRLHLRSEVCLARSRTCPHCAKVFSDKTRLQIHLRSHTGERPFHCAQCQKTFAQNRSLKEHALTHLRERNFKCDRCPKAFVQKNHLKYHAASRHAFVSPENTKHVCKICSKTFCFSSQLRTHERMHVKTLTKRISKEMRENNATLPNGLELHQPHCDNSTSSSESHKEPKP